MVITYALLGVAIVTEVTGTLALRASDGFSKLGSSIAVCTCYVVAFIALSFVLKRGLSVAVAYALWSAAGILAISVIGVLFLNERLTFVQVMGMTILVIGVVVLQLGTGFAAQA